jgi:hypothetical protein
MKIAISEKEVLRFLGYRGASADERIHSIIDELIGLFTSNVIPKSVYGIWDCQIDSSTTVFGGMTVKSKSLAGHLADCRQLVLLAATLGTQADTLIRSLSIQDMEKAVIAQALCAAMLEAYCDLITNKITSQNLRASAPPRELLLQENLYPTTRFNPGYGDFDISYQKNILKILNCSSIGLSMTDGYMLTPTKSVTAIIGFSPEKKRVTQKCERCSTPCALSSLRSPKKPLRLGVFAPLREIMET